ncbi:hypothetical protein NLG97_g10407 [Lecanicillium saksenae]|uniref:Uncharacterized protein n=1 Tax=Lecanicillium saksenae TaxID=468837 RepID=A0ACC1QH56_9HYPO|nr:hypothetical protein NLG97_g10407 [Lecanicillium saksenae]
MPIFQPSSSALDNILAPREASFWERLVSKPCLTIAESLYKRLGHGGPSRPPKDAVSVVCISDTHNNEIPIPYGDILVHAGDLTQSGTYSELQASLSWLAAQPHPIKVVMAGNHDVLLDEANDAIGSEQENLDKRKLLLRDTSGLICLQDTSITTTAPNGRCLRIYGSPQSPRQGNWAFQYPRFENIWAERLMGDYIDILVTHCPPLAHLDLGYGCVHLLRQLWRVRPRLHVCGHIHAAAGIEYLAYDDLQYAYEQVVIHNHLRTFVAFLIALAIGLITPGRTETQTVLVNAAIVGGIRDSFRRGTVKVVV